MKGEGPTWEFNKIVLVKTLKYLNYKFYSPNKNERPFYPFV